jgi:hypothetical protein
MTPQQTIFRISKSIAGAIVAGLGMFILYENVAGAVSHLLGANGSEALGVLPAAFLALAQAVQTYAVNHQRFLEACFRQTLVSAWPLLLVIFGTVLSRDTLTDGSKH